MNIQIVNSSEDYATGVVDEVVVISVARGTASLDDAIVQSDEIRRVASLHPGKCGFVCCIEPTSPKPSAEFQSVVTKMFLEVGQNLGAVAHIMEGKGARSALVRMTLMSMAFLKGAPQPTEYFNDSIDAIQWLIETLRFPVNTITPNMVEEVRQAILTDGNEKVV